MIHTNTVKTEKEFTEIFYNSCQHYTSEQNELKKLSKTYWIDLTGHLTGYFSLENRLAITLKAIKLVNENLSHSPLEEAWQHVVRNFHQQNHWGFQTTSVKPVYEKTEDQKIFWKLFKYVWAFFQSMIILKIAVYYFGLESANNPDETNVIWVWIFFSLSVSSLVFFAYRNRKDQG